MRNLVITAIVALALGVAACSTICPIVGSIPVLGSLCPTPTPAPTATP